MDVKQADAICELLRKYREVALWRGGLADRQTQALRIEVQDRWGGTTHVIPLGLNIKPGKRVYDTLRAALYDMQDSFAAELKCLGVDIGRTMTDADLDERERVLTDEEAS